MSLTTTAIALNGGIAPVSGVNEVWTITFDGSWQECDRVTTTLTVLIDGTQYQFGAGDTTGINPSFCYTYGKRVYVLSADTTYFSALGFPTVFNDPNAIGNGNIQMSDYFAAPEDLQSIAHYQGRLAFITRKNVQLWTTNADPTAFVQNQVLENIGTFAPESVKPLGDLDVLMLYDSGVRSIRVRDSSLNAFVVDVGSPIDSVVISTLQGMSDAQKAACCAVVEPETNRYWLFLKDTIYVLSYFPANKITAWSQYDPTYDVAGAQTAFTPVKMVAYKGQVYVRDSDGNLFVYGGAAGTTYDGVTAILETPWLDNRTPATSKAAKAVDIGMVGQWKISYGLDPLSNQLVLVGQATQVTYDMGRVGLSGRGTHFKLHCESQKTGAAKISELIYHYKQEENK